MKDDGTVPISGVITLGDIPLSDVQVTFWSKEQQFVGVTGPDGRYELKPGAVPGSYKVSISRGLVALGVEPGGSLGKDALQSSLSIPSSYGDPTTTPLSVDVEDQGSKTVDFAILSE